MGLSGGASLLDGVAKIDLAKAWDLSPFYQARGPRITGAVGLTGAYIYDTGMLPVGWDDRSLTEAWGMMQVRMPQALFADSGYAWYRASGAVGGAGATFTRADLDVRSVNYYHAGYEAMVFRGYAAASSDLPAQAALHLSANDPLSTFDDDW